MSLSFGGIVDTSLTRIKTFTANLAQAAATYDLATCNTIGGINILDIQIYVVTAGATLTSIAIQTNDTTPVIVLTALEGALANLTVGKNVLKVFTGPTYLHTSKKLQYTLVGATGTGSLLIVVRYQPTVSGADIS